MFKDYYQILGVSFGSSKEKIKQAYRRMSLKWHPDRNPSVDVTEIMQDINEAYKILNDDDSRRRYDKEYQRFYQQKKECFDVCAESNSSSWTYDYDIHDETLREDINTARAYAKDLVDEFLKSLKKTSKVEAKGAWEGAYGYILAGIILTIIFAFIRTCE